jgi:hypothetical protein
MSLWWYQQQLVDAIAVDSVAPGDHGALLRRDPAVSGLYRGFLLEHKIFGSFHMSCLSIPTITNCDRHILWAFWAIAIDMALSHRCDVNEGVFDMLMKTFSSAPFPAAFPVFAYFMAIPEFHERVVDALLRNIDELPNPDNSPMANSQLWKAIVELRKGSARALILLAKLIAASEISPFEQHFRSPSWIE